MRNRHVEQETTVSNPFEDPNASYCALINEQDQYSLWPAGIDVPSGWTVVHGPTDRESCLEYIEAQWTDIRPARSGYGSNRRPV